jgi:hypothetical protein
MSFSLRQYYLVQVQRVDDIVLSAGLTPSSPFSSTKFTGNISLHRARAYNFQFIPRYKKKSLVGKAIQRVKK